MLNIIDQYSSTDRHYHNFNHISKMLMNLNYFSSLNDIEKIKLRLAILYHDYVYDINSGTNEEDSVDAFMDDLMNNKIHYKNKMVSISNIGASVMVMIMDTKDHIPRTKLSNVLIDLDLWELADKDQYKINSLLIEKEFSSIPYYEFIEGRILWLQEMLNKDQIYYTKYCANNEFENRARENIKNELMELRELKNENIGIKR